MALAPWQRFLLIDTSGGLEMLFSDQRKHSLRVPGKDDKGNAVTVGWLIHHLCDEVMKDTRKEMFVLEDHVYGPLRPHRFSTLFYHQINAFHISHSTFQTVMQVQPAQGFLRSRTCSLPRICPTVSSCTSNLRSTLSLFTALDLLTSSLQPPRNPGSHQ